MYAHNSHSASTAPKKWVEGGVVEAREDDNYATREMDEDRSFDRTSLTLRGRLPILR